MVLVSHEKYGTLSIYVFFVNFVKAPTAVTRYSLYNVKIKQHQSANIEFFSTAWNSNICLPISVTLQVIDVLYQVSSKKGYRFFFDLSDVYC